MFVLGIVIIHYQKAGYGSFLLIFSYNPILKHVDNELSRFQDLGIHSVLLFGDFGQMWPFSGLERGPEYRETFL